MRDVYPALFDHDDGHGHMVKGITEGKQAVNQLIAAAITFIVAVTGGALTGNYGAIDNRDSQPAILWEFFYLNTIDVLFL